MSTEKTRAAGENLVNTMERVERRFKDFYRIAALMGIGGIGSIVGGAEHEADIVETLGCFERGIAGIEEALNKAARAAGEHLSKPVATATAQAGGEQ